MSTTPTIRIDLSQLPLEVDGKTAKIEIIGADGKPLAFVVAMSNADGTWHDIDVRPAADRPSQAVAFGWHGVNRHDVPLKSAAAYAVDFPKPGGIAAHDPDTTCRDCRRNRDYLKDVASDA